MRKGVFTKVGERCRLPAMFFVAVAAGKTGGFLNDAAVQLCDIQHLSGNIRVTLQAAVCHTVAFPRRRVTNFTFGDFRMGRDAAHRFAGLRIQRTGTEHLRAAGKCHANKHKQGYECGDKP